MSMTRSPRFDLSRQQWVLVVLLTALATVTQGATSVAGYVVQAAVVFAIAYAGVAGGAVAVRRFSRS